MITPLPFRMHASVAALWCLAATTAFSAQPGASTAAPQQGDEIAHAVKEGDTLEGLARSYLANPRQWPLLQSRNKVADPKRLQPGSLIFIPVRLQPSESATVQFVQGEATAQARGNGTPVPIATGSKLEEGTELKVGPESFVAVQLADGTVVRVQAQSELQLRQLRQLRRRGRAGSAQSVLEMHKGGVESTAPQRRAAAPHGNPHLAGGDQRGVGRFGPDRGVGIGAMQAFHQPGQCRAGF